MKSYLASLLRHSLTSLAAVGGLLFSHGLLATGDVASVNAAGLQLRDAITVIGSALVARAALTLSAKIFPAGAGEIGATSGGASLLLIVTAAGLMGALPSCTSAQLTKTLQMPITACFTTDQATTCYRSKSGLSLTVEPDSGK